MSLYQVAYTHTDLPAHRTEQYLLPLRALDIPAPSVPAMTLGYTAEDADCAERFLRAQGLDDRPFVAVAPTTTWPSRCWPPERYAALGDWLARREGQGVVLVGTARDHATLEGITDRMEAPAALFVGGFSFREMAALLARAALVVSGDTGPMHAAAALGVPSLALFGSTPVTGRAPLVGRGTALSRAVPCGPCDKPDCANGGPDFLRCLTLISVSEAHEAAAALLDTPSRRTMRKLILRNFQSPGDIVMLTAAVRDLHAACPGQFLTDVRTPCPELWQNNPHLSPLSEDDPEAEVIDCQYPLIHQSNFRPYHFLHGFIAFLNERLGLDIRPTAFQGDIHISDAEKAWFSRVEEKAQENTPFWLITAGGKHDFTAKWWDHDRYQKVVDHFQGRIEFVQVGEGGHHHPALKGVVDLRGSTDLRMLIRLMHHAQGALTPVSLLMHLAAAVPVKPGMPQNRPCVVVAGGREAPHWEAYPHHQFIHTVGQLRCCDNGGCWKARTVPLGDGSELDHPDRLCVDPVRLPSGHHLPRCLDMISVDEVIRRIEGYFEGRAIRPLTASAVSSPAARNAPAPPRRPVTIRKPRPRLAFATCTDRNFLPGARGLIRSIRKFYPDSADIVCYADTHDRDFAHFAREHDVTLLYPASVRAWAVPLIYEDPRYAADTSHFYHPQFAPPPGAPAYQRACLRPGFGEIHHLHALNLKAYVTGYCLLVMGYDRVVHIDADAFLLGPVDEMFARHPEPSTMIAFEDRNIIHFPYVPETLPNLETVYGVAPPLDFDADRFAFNAGVVFYRNGPGMRELASDFLFYIESCYHFDHSGCMDQGILRYLAAKHEILGNVRYVLEDNACWNPDQQSAEDLELRGGQWINRRNWQVQRIYHSYNRHKLWPAKHPSPSVNAAWRWAGGEYASP